MAIPTTPQETPPPPEFSPAQSEKIHEDIRSSANLNEAEALTYTTPPPSLHPTVQRHAFTMESQKVLLREVVSLRPYLKPDMWDAVTNRYGWWCYDHFNPKRRMVPKDRIRKKVKSILATYHQKKNPVATASASASASSSGTVSASAKVSTHFDLIKGDLAPDPSDHHASESTDELPYDSETIELIEKVVQQYTESVELMTSRRLGRINRVKSLSGPSVTAGSDLLEPDTGIGGTGPHTATMPPPMNKPLPSIHTATANASAMAHINSTAYNSRPSGSYSTPLGINDMIHNNDNNDHNASFSPPAKRQRPNTHEPGTKRSHGSMADILADEDDDIQMNSPRMTPTSEEAQATAKQHTSKPNGEELATATATAKVEQEESSQRVATATATSTSTATTTTTPATAAGASQFGSQPKPAGSTVTTSTTTTNTTTTNKTSSPLSGTTPIPDANQFSQTPHAQQPVPNIAHKPSLQQQQEGHVPSPTIDATANASVPSSSNSGEGLTAAASVNINMQNDAFNRNEPPSPNKQPVMTPEFMSSLRDILEDNNKARIEMMKEFGTSFGAALGASLGASLSSTIAASLDRVMSQTAARMSEGISDRNKYEDPSATTSTSTSMSHALPPASSLLYTDKDTVYQTLASATKGTIESQVAANNRHLNQSLNRLAGGNSMNGKTSRSGGSNDNSSNSTRSNLSNLNTNSNSNIEPDGSTKTTTTNPPILTQLSKDPQTNKTTVTTVMTTAGTPLPPNYALKDSASDGS